MSHIAFTLGYSLQRWLGSSCNAVADLEAPRQVSVLGVARGGACLWCMKCFM